MSIRESLFKISNYAYKAGFTTSILGGVIGSAFYTEEHNEYAVTEVSAMVIVFGFSGASYGFFYGIVLEAYSYFTEDNISQVRQDENMGRNNESTELVDLFLSEYDYDINI